MLMIATTRTRNGNAINTSTRRMKSVSRRPPRYPVAMPIKLPKRNGNATENSPIWRSRRVLQTMRLQTSRPKLSVPSGWPGLSGGLNASARFWTIGSYGVSSGAHSATRMTNASSSRPASSVGFRPIFWSRMLKLRPSRGASAGRTRPRSSTCSLIRHPRIEERIRQIDDQIDDDHHERADDRDCLHYRIIAAGDRGHQELTHARYREDRFDHERAAHQE